MPFGQKITKPCHTLHNSARSSDVQFISLIFLVSKEKYWKLAFKLLTDEMVAGVVHLRSIGAESLNSTWSAQWPFLKRSCYVMMNSITSETILKYSCPVIWSTYAKYQRNGADVHWTSGVLLRVSDINKLNISCEITLFSERNNFSPYFRRTRHRAPRAVLW